MNDQVIQNLLKISAPVLFYGAPGIGKTATVHKNYDHVEVILLSACCEEDIGGLPYRDGDHDYKTMPAFFKRLHDADSAGQTTALFLDEIDKAERSVSDTLLTLVGSRKVNGKSLPEKTKIILAANPPEYGGGDGLSTPMLNRCAVVEFEPSACIWASEMLERFKNEESAAIVSQVLSGVIPILESVGVGIDQRTTSPRSLTMALQSLYEISGMEGKIREDLADKILSGLVTPNAASKIMKIIRSSEDDKYKHVFEKAEAVVKNAAKRKIKPLEL